MVPRRRKQPASGPKALSLGQCMATAWHVLLQLFTQQSLFPLTCRAKIAAQKFMNLLPASWSSSSRSNQPQQQKAPSVSRRPASKADDRQKLVDLHQLAKVRRSRATAVCRHRESGACGLGASYSPKQMLLGVRHTLCSVPSCCSQLQRRSQRVTCSSSCAVWGFTCYVSVLQSSVQDPMASSSWSCDIHMLTSIAALRLPLVIALQDALARAYEQHMSGQPGALHSYQIALEAINAGLQLDVPDAWLQVTSSHKLRSDLLKWRQDAASRWPPGCGGVLVGGHTGF